MMTYYTLSASGVFSCANPCTHFGDEGQCDFCKLWIHFQCNNMSGLPEQCRDDEGRVSSAFFICPRCLFECIGMKSHVALPVDKVSVTGKRISVFIECLVIYIFSLYFHFLLIFVDSGTRMDDASKSITYDEKVEECSYFFSLSLLSTVKKCVLFCHCKKVKNETKKWIRQIREESKKKYKLTRPCSTTAVNAMSMTTAVDATSTTTAVDTTSTTTAVNAMSMTTAVDATSTTTAVDTTSTTTTVNAMSMTTAVDATSTTTAFDAMNGTTPVIGMLQILMVLELPKNLYFNCFWGL